MMHTCLLLSLYFNKEQQHLVGQTLLKEDTFNLVSYIEFNRKITQYIKKSNAY